MKKDLTKLTENLTKIRGNNANLEIVKELSIVYQGKKEKIKYSGNFRLNWQGKLIVQVFEPKKAQLIKEVILATKDFQQTSEDRAETKEKNELCFSLVPMTREIRQRLLKEANKIIEDGKIKLQNSRREILKKASLNEKEQAKKEVDKVKDKYLLEIQKLQKAKEKELEI
jgi:ribosome recycling factor